MFCTHDVLRQRAASDAPIARRLRPRIGSIRKRLRYRAPRSETNAKFAERANLLEQVFGGGDVATAFAAVDPLGEEFLACPEFEAASWQWG
jgi:hypothetical protein